MITPIDTLTVPNGTDLEIVPTLIKNRLSC